MFPVVYSYKPGGSTGREDTASDLLLSAGDGNLGESGESSMDNGDLGGGEARQPVSSQSFIPAGANRRSHRTPSLSQIAADRPIFTLSVAADLLGLHPRTLRIYEEKGLVVPSRTEGNRRRYSQNDIQRFQFIRQLTRGGVNLEGVRIILDMTDELIKLGGDPSAVIERSLQASPISDEP